MAYTIELTEEAAEQVEALPKKIAGQVIRKIEALATEPRPTQARRLTEHEDLSRVRSGDDRVLYKIEDRTLLVLVVKVGDRRDVDRRIPASDATSATERDNRRDPRPTHGDTRRDPG